MKGRRNSSSPLQEEEHVGLLHILMVSEIESGMKNGDFRQIQGEAISKACWFLVVTSCIGLSLHFESSPEKCWWAGERTERRADVLLPADI